MNVIRALLVSLATASCVLGQTTGDPFPAPIATDEGVITVNFVEFASLPDIDGEPARMMGLVGEPGTRRLFVSDMRGPVYRVSDDGSTVTMYLDIDAANWGVDVESGGRERGVQSFTVHPSSTSLAHPATGSSTP